MPSFTLRGLTLTLPDAALRGGLERAFTTGRYEHQEADAILAHLRPGDRFMDLGAGIGFLCALAARVVGAAAVVGGAVETTPVEVVAALSSPPPPHPVAEMVRARHTPMAAAMVERRMDPR